MKIIRSGPVHGWCGCHGEFAFEDHGEDWRAWQIAHGYDPDNEPEPVLVTGFSVGVVTVKDE